MTNMTNTNTNTNMIEANLQAVLKKIATHTQPTHLVTVIAASKKQPLSAILQARAAGQRAFGENYVQEGVQKIIELQLKHPELAKTMQWHLIGALQNNKTRLVATHFDWVHTISDFKTAQRLSLQRPLHLPPLQILLQINIDAEPNKHGIIPEYALALTQAIAPLPRLQLRGLMCIPEKNQIAYENNINNNINNNIIIDNSSIGESFARMQRLLTEINRANNHANNHTNNYKVQQLDVLSMGMSQDFEAALEQGATHLRIGTAIFGLR